MKKLVVSLFSAFLFSTLVIFTASAKTKTEQHNLPPVEITEGENDQIYHIDFTVTNEKLKSIRNDISQKNLTAKDIDEYVSFLTGTEGQISDNKKVLDRQIKFIRKQLDALGENPTENEDPIITEQRNTLSQEMMSLDKVLKESDLLLIQIEDMTVQVLNARSQKIYGDLITKQSAFINPLVFFSGVKGYVVFFWDIVKSPLEWYKNLPQEQRSFAVANLITMFVILLVAFGLALILRRLILKNWGYKEDIKFPHFNQKVIAAIAVATARGVIYAFLVSGCLLWMISTKIFSESFLEVILTTIAITTLFAIVEATISRVTFAPHYPQWRLINITSEKASRFTRMIFMFIVINAIVGAQVILAQRTQYPPQTLHFIMIVDCAVKAFFLMWFTKISFDTYKDEIRVDSTEASTEEDENSIDIGFRIILASYLFCIGVFTISLFGYPELSLFIFNRIIATLILCGVFEVLRRSIIDLAKRLIFVGPWMKGFKNRKRIIAKMEFWLKAFINPILVLILIFMLLNVWGLPGDFVLQLLKKILLGFKVGGIEISLISIALGIAVFFGSLTLVKLIKNRLATNILDKVDMDDGIKHSLISGIGFIGFIISALLAIIAVGIDLTNLAFIAGALSVGIGFGLQDVIKNLVAGIIILLERPFKVGDWVVLSGTEGTIKQINIRSTELLSFNKTSVIIPNATLISSSVTNLTHGDAMSRQTIAVGVAYGSDPEKVRDILLDCAAKNRKVLKNPAPYVIFKDFGSSSLDFELRFYVNDIWKGWTTPSDLRYEIFNRFKQEGIEIPFPQIVINKPSSETDSQKDTTEKI